MSQPGFTPGPYRRVGKSIRAKIGGIEVQIGGARTYIRPDAKLGLACTFADHQTARANADLWAAAPDLHAALSELVRLKDLKATDPEQYERLKPGAWDAARAALSKVTAPPGPPAGAGEPGGPSDG